MIDFWVAVLITIIITILTVLVDWVATKLIVAGRTIHSLQRITRSGLSINEAMNRVKDQLERYSRLQTSSLAWGVSLAIVAISLDFTALSMWIYKPNMFPFFSILNTDEVSREIHIWLIVIFVHIIIMILSMAMKHNHEYLMGAETEGESSEFSERGWLLSNGWMLGANLSGFVALLSGIVILTNAW